MSVEVVLAVVAAWFALSLGAGLVVGRAAHLRDLVERPPHASVEQEREAQARENV